MSEEPTPFRPRIVAQAAVHTDCEVLAAIQIALAILHAIDQGGLLEELPDDPSAQARHETAVTLLGVLENRLRQSIEGPDGLVSGDCPCRKHSVQSAFDDRPHS